MNPVAPVTSPVLLILAVNYLCLCDAGLYCVLLRLVILGGIGKQAFRKALDAP